LELSPSSILVRASSHLCCELGSELSILNTVDNKYYGLNELGAAIWKALDQPRTVACLRESLLTQFEVEDQQLASDLATFLTKLIERELVAVQ